MQPVKWFYRGSVPMVAIYPDDLEGGTLKTMRVADGLRPVRWTHNGSGVGMAIFGESTLRNLPPIDRDPALAPVRWFHSERYPITANFNTEYPEEESGYEGPLDIVSGALAAFSMRAMAAGSTANAITIRRDSDDATQTFALTDNAVDAAAVAAFIGAGDGFGAVWKDQSGNDFHASDTPAIPENPPNSPLWKIVPSNSLPGLGGKGGRLQYQPINGNPPITWPAGQALTFFAVATLEASDTSGNYVFALESWGDTSASIELGLAPQFPDYDQTSADGEDYVEWDGEGDFSGLHIWELTITTDGTVTILLDGVDIEAVVSGTPAPTPEVTDGFYEIDTLVNNGGGDGSFYFEQILYPSLLSSGNRLALRQNMAAYYGITLP